MGTVVKTRSIFTFGYGNRKTYNDLLECFEKYQIDCLIDVRSTPRAWTRKWYGQQIENFCSEHEIEYFSEPALGNTSGSKNWIPPNQSQADQALDKLAKKNESQNILLLCAELDYKRCHRTEVAEKLQKLTGHTITHLL